MSQAKVQKSSSAARDSALKTAKSGNSDRSPRAMPNAIRARRSGRDWPARYAGRLVYSDTAVVALVLAGYWVLAGSQLQDTVSWPTGPMIPNVVAPLVLAALWLLALAIYDTRDRHIVGNGTLEYQRIINASLAVFTVCVTVAFFARADVARSLLILAVPAGVIVLILSRWARRQWLRAQQRMGKYVFRALVVAEPSKAVHIIDAIRRAHGSGFDIVGVVTDGRAAPSLAGVPVVGDFAHAIHAMDVTDADTIIIAGADELDPATMRRLGWAVADRDGNLVVAPALTDVAGPRIHSRPAAGLPLVHVEFPRLEGGKAFAKRTFDVLGSAVLIVFFLPFMVITAIAVKVDSRGPLFYRQERIGRRGQRFGMIKFRSMSKDSDDQLASLLDLQGNSEQPLFKVTDDPRITRVGRFLRKHSIDEVPQLFNVLLGDMSLVGPRPQRDAEVALYDDDAHRRLLVKPGMSGLWQVSGRSALSWEDALRLDLYYVENWSFTQDIHILFRTFRAVLAPGGDAH